MPNRTDPEPGPAAAALADELLAASRRAFDVALFEAAYHSLLAALHAAETPGDAGRLAAIAAEATRQQDGVDRRAPDHRLSRGSGRQHGHPGWFHAAAQLAQAAIVRLQAADVLNRSEATRRSMPPFGDAAREAPDA